MISFQRYLTRKLKRYDKLYRSYIRLLDNVLETNNFDNYRLYSCLYFSRMEKIVLRQHEILKDLLAFKTDECTYQELTYRFSELDEFKKIIDGD